MKILNDGHSFSANKTIIKKIYIYIFHVSFSMKFVYFSLDLGSNSSSNDGVEHYNQAFFPNTCKRAHFQYFKVLIVTRWKFSYFCATAGNGFSCIMGFILPLLKLSSEESQKSHEPLKWSALQPHTEEILVNL